MTKHENTYVNHYNSKSDTIMIVIVCTGVTFGLAILWILDQLVYHKILDSFFLVGLKMEYDIDKLPPIRFMMIDTAGGKGLDYLMRLYYFIPLGGFIIISIMVTVSQGLYELESNKIGTMNNSSVDLILILVQITILGWMFIKSREADIIKRMESAYPNAHRFLNIIKEKEYSKIIERNHSAIRQKNQNSKIIS